MKKPVVAIVGRPNVGKSTLFNRVLRKRDAIVDDQPGVTRDRHDAETEWRGRPFVLVDTGGFIPGSDDPIQQAVETQVHYAIAEADAIALVVDVSEGVTPLDEHFAQLLQRTDKPVLLVANKADDARREAHAVEFYRLGLGEPVPVSAELGRGVGDLLDRFVERLPEVPKEAAGEDRPPIKLAVVGRPNVGKSSFINALLGKEKLIVTQIPGTTRDAIDTRFRYSDQEYLLIDTAGLRKRSRIHEAVEYYSVRRALESIRRCDVAIVLMDAYEGLREQDKKVIGEAVSQKKGIVLAVNKWDLLEKDSRTASLYERALRQELPWASYLPIIFISAKRKQRIFKVLEVAHSVHEERNKRITTASLNQFLKQTLEANPPPSPQGKELKIKYVTQVKSAPPVFAFFMNHPKLMPDNYRQFLENSLREQFGFLGVPLTLVFRKK